MFRFRRFSVQFIGVLFASLLSMPPVEATSFTIRPLAVVQSSPLSTQALTARPISYVRNLPAKILPYRLAVRYEFIVPSFLDNSIHHGIEAARLLGMPQEVIQQALSPNREIFATTRWSSDEAFELLGGHLGEGGVVQGDTNPKSADSWRVVHDKGLYSSKGGVRAVFGLTVKVVKALALEMSVKVAGIVGIPLGGAKGGIAVNPKGFSKGEYARLMRGYVSAMMTEVYAQYGEIAFGFYADSPAPDVNTSPAGIPLMNIAVDEMIRWLVRHDQMHANGKELPIDLPMELKDIQPTQLGNGAQTPYVDLLIRLSETEKYREAGLSVLFAAFTGKTEDKWGSKGRTPATGKGVAFNAYQAMKANGDLTYATERRFDGRGNVVTVAVQGFGNVGRWAASSFEEMHASVRAIAEWDGQMYAFALPQGMPQELFQAMCDYKDSPEHGQSLRGFEQTELGQRYGVTPITIKQFWASDVTILAPCAGENLITRQVAKWIRARYIVEGANGPTTQQAERILNKKGVTVVPDVQANSGGVRVSYMEMLQNQTNERWSFEQVMEKLWQETEESYLELLAIRKEFLRSKITLRTAAYIRWARVQWKRVGSTHMEQAARAQVEQAA